MTGQCGHARRTGRPAGRPTERSGRRPTAVREEPAADAGADWLRWHARAAASLGRSCWPPPGPAGGSTGSSTATSPPTPPPPPSSRRTRRSAPTPVVARRPEHPAHRLRHPRRQGQPQVRPGRGGTRALRHHDPAAPRRRPEERHRGVHPARPDGDIPSCRRPDGTRTRRSSPSSTGPSSSAVRPARSVPSRS